MDRASFYALCVIAPPQAADKYHELQVKLSDIEPRFEQCCKNYRELAALWESAEARLEAAELSRVNSIITLNEKLDGYVEHFIKLEAKLDETEKLSERQTELGVDLMEKLMKAEAKVETIRSAAVLAKTVGNGGVHADSILETIRRE